MSARLIRKNIVLHCALWLVYLTFETIVAYRMGAHEKFWIWIIYFCLDIALFYFNAEVVLRPIGSARQKGLRIIVLGTFELFAYIFLSFFIGKYTEKGAGDLTFSTINPNDLLRTIWVALQMIIFSTGYWFLKRSNAARILQLEAEKNLAIARYAHLQAQINPHFLFNSLSFIYNSVAEVSPVASHGISLLSEMMRYALSDDAKDGKVTIQDETEQISRFIQMNQLRFGNRLQLRYEVFVEEKCKTCRIPSLLLLTYVENVFKHGEMNKPGHPASIRIHCNDDLLCLQTENLIKKTDSIADSDHVGLKNALARLKDYYTEKDFNLNIQESDANFIVDLKIRL